MTEWGIVGVIVTLVGLIAAVTAPMIRLNGTLTKLTAQMEHFNAGLEEFKRQYDRQLEKFEGVHEDLYNEIGNHEHRITVLETEKGRELL